MQIIISDVDFGCSCIHEYLIILHKFSLGLLGNPLEEKHSTEGDWRDKATGRLPKLKKLDG